MDNRCGTVPPYCSSLTNPILTAPPSLSSLKLPHISLSHCFPHFSITSSSNTPVALYPMLFTQISYSYRQPVHCTATLSTNSSPPTITDSSTLAFSSFSSFTRDLAQLYFRHKQDGSYRVQTKPGSQHWEKSDPVIWRMRSADYS